MITSFRINLRLRKWMMLITHANLCVSSLRFFPTPDRCQKICSLIVLLRCFNKNCLELTPFFIFSTQSVMLCTWIRSLKGTGEPSFNLMNSATFGGTFLLGPHCMSEGRVLHANYLWNTIWDHKQCRQHNTSLCMENHSISSRTASAVVGGLFP